MLTPIHLFGQNEPKVFDLDKAEKKETPHIAIFKGEKHKVFATSKGKLFIELISEKTGKIYRRYIKTDENEN